MNGDWQAAWRQNQDHEPGGPAIRIGGPVKAVSKRGAIGVEWWSRAWVEAIEAIYDPNYLSRGKRYARNGSVHDLAISYGQVTANVYDSPRYEPHHSALLVNQFSSYEWEMALSALSVEALHAAKLLAGEMPESVPRVFRGLNLSLFPQKSAELILRCSCGEWYQPCKHTAALCYLVAEQLDADPFILFHLHGRSQEQVLAALRPQTRDDGHEAAPGEAEAPASLDHVPPLDADLSSFWALPDPPGEWAGQTPQIPEEAPTLSALGAPPGGIGEDLQRLYGRVSQAAHKRLLAMSEMMKAMMNGR